jgi:hypothetical protein
MYKANGKRIIHFPVSERRNLMRLMAYFFTLNLVLFLTSLVRAQNSLEIMPLSGIRVFAPGTVSLTGKSYGFEAAYNIYQRDKKTEWIKRLRVRDISLVAGYRNMNQVAITDSTGSRGFLRSAYTLSSKLNTTLLSVKRTELLLLTGFGLTYSPSSYFSDGNPLVGSKLNFSPHAGLKLRTPVSGSISLAAGANIFHYSNVGFRIPNNGINSMELSFSIINEFKNTPNEVKEQTPDKLRGFVEIGADIGQRGVFKAKGVLWKSGLYAGYNYRINRVVSVTAGTNAVYYYTPFDGTGETFQYFATSYDRWRYGVAVGSDLWLGKLIASANYGYYIKFNGYYPIKYYWTTGLKYYTNRWLGFQGRIYAHKSQAEFAGFGVMFRIAAQTFK